MLVRTLLNTGQVQVEELPEWKAAVAIVVQGQCHSYRIQEGYGVAFEAFVSLRSLSYPSGCHCCQGDAEIVFPGLQRLAFRLSLSFCGEEFALPLAGV